MPNYCPGGGTTICKMEESLHWADYLVFALFLLLMMAPGLYYGLIGTKKAATTDEFLVGKRDNSIFPVALSILSSFLSAILILGTPAEVYTQGTMYWMYIFGMCGAVIFSVILFVPLLYPLRLTSSFEYLEMRFHSRAARLTGTMVIVALQVLYMGVALYSPATALAAVTGFPEWASIVIGGGVAIVYTGLGGMKASIYASVLQTFLMAAGVIAVIIKGTSDVGGIDKVWELNDKYGRLEFFEFDPDPTKRHSFWTLIVGGTIGWLATYGANQASVQRYSSLPTLTKAKITVLLNIPGLIFFVTICVLSGMVMFAYYVGKLECDIYAAEFIESSNQIMPYYVLDQLGYPTVPGLFLACLFSGSLSSVSSSLAALAAVTWEDILKYPLDHLSMAAKTLTTKLLILAYGAAGIGFSFIVAGLGSTVLQASLSFTGAAGGPLLGLFLLAGLFPCAEWLGAVIGGIIGLAFPLWISFGAYEIGVSDPYLNTTVINCQYGNLTLDGTLWDSDSPDIFRYEDISGIESLYLVSYLWYPAIGAATTIVIALIVSSIKGCYDPANVDGKLMMPIFQRIFCCLPEKTLDILRCKIHIPSPQEIDDERTAELERKAALIQERLQQQQELAQVGGTSFETPKGDLETGYHNKAMIEDNEPISQQPGPITKEDPPEYNDIHVNEITVAPSNSDLKKKRSDSTSSSDSSKSGGDNIETEAF